MKMIFAALLCVLPMLANATESGINLENFDNSIRAQDDFFRHVNGQWLKTTSIPADKSDYSSFSALADRTEKQLLDIIQDAAKSSASGEAQQVGDLYASFMDENAANRAQLAPLQADLMLIERFNQHAQLPSLMAQLETIGVEGLFSAGIFEDAQDPDAYILYVEQHGLGLPDREYYLEDSKKFIAARQAYKTYIQNLLQQAGTIDAKQHATAILALETRIAKTHWDRVASRDAQKTYNRRALKSINDNTPQFDFSAWLNGIGIHSIDAVVLSQPSFFQSIGAIVAETSIDTWREYLRLRLLDAYAPYLNDALVQAHFNFHGKALLGISENKPRWKRGVDLVEGKLGEALGKIYVQRHFPPQAKARMKDLVANLIEAYRQSIVQLEWMGEDTRIQALDKLAKFRTKIGYPDSWRDYSGLEIQRGNLAANVQRANRFTHEYHLAKLGQPINEDEWLMTPQRVNAYYHPIANEIVFPAAILQPPFFNLDADDAVNYGGIGAVIGHEIGHGFDDQGSRYDGDGRLRNWWTEQDRENFEKRTSQLISQYNGYSPLPGHNVNGALTIGENIGDLGGLSIAAKAYKLSLQGTPAPVLDGYSGMQRMFIGWAQVWRRLYRDDALLNRLKTDPHSPGEYRCNGTVSNVPEFYQAFDIKPEDGMFHAPEDRVTIW
ncbi:MAG: M13 family metallopeptidase [Oceanococcus sp.]